MRIDLDQKETARLKLLVARRNTGGELAQRADEELAAMIAEKSGGTSMTNKEIVEKSIQKAVDNGLSQFELFGEEEFDTIFIYIKDHKLIGKGAALSMADIVFNHDFAKALWGEHQEKVRKYTDESGATNYPPLPPRVVNAGWQYHLQQMVISEDPIKYLGENI